MCYEMWETYKQRAQDGKANKIAPRKEKMPAAMPAAQPQPAVPTTERQKDERELEVVPA